MIDSNILEYKNLEPLNVSRETFPQFEAFCDLLKRENNNINLISKSTEKEIRKRHIVDCAQTIEFIDENYNICTDVGSGSGLPGIVLAIIMKVKKPDMKFHLYEKSFRKCEFLSLVKEKLGLNAEVFQKDIFKEKNIETDLIIARAFKPLPVILDLAEKNFKKFKSVIIFLGKNKKNILKETLINWSFDYKEKKSITSSDSKIINISNLKKK
ncbi:MAG: 16S rRNA (guanine(527)-N(7))-methyltransferase RsmG [Candidatus Pelagibacter sp.]